MALEQFSDVVQRCAAVSVDSYTTEDHDVFLTAGRACIEEGEAAQVLSIVLDDSNTEVVKHLGWNLLPPLIQVLLKKEERSLPQCLNIFNHLLQSCGPKELLIGLLEKLEHDDPEAVAENLHLLLTPLQKVLLRLGSRKASSLGMTLSSVLEQVAKLPLPVSREEEENDVSSLCRCCAELTAFVRPFVLEVEQSDGEMRTGPQSEEEDELRTELLKFCMKTLSRPLLEVHLQDSEALAESPLRDFASETLNTLQTLREPLSGLVFQPLLRRRQLPGFMEEEVRYPRESLASLAHLVFVHLLAADVFPYVFSPVFCLRCNMEHVCLLLSRTEENRIQKGLELYEKSLLRVDSGSLPVELLEIRTFLAVPQNLVNVMTMCSRKDLRTKGLKVFQLSIDKFDTEAKHKLFQYMLTTTTHSGVQGYVIKNIKNQIDLALQPGNSNAWFQGIHLMPLLRKVLMLPDGPETDLVQNLDRLMESLNLLRYLVIRDKVTENQTGIWSELYKVEDSFLKPLRVGLNMSRAHYERELHITMESKKNKVKEEPKMSVSVDDEQLPAATSESQIQALHSFLHTFDMIQSVLVRIEELIDDTDKP